MNNEPPNTTTDQLWIWGITAGLIVIAAIVKYAPRLEKWLFKMKPFDETKIYDK